MEVSLISMTENPFGTIEKATSMCYRSKPSLAAVKHCYRSGHESVLEHANFTFLIKGVSRVLLAQLTRHRLVSFSVVSQRYCSMEDAEMVYPVKEDNYRHTVFAQAYERALKVYQELQMSEVPNEDARFVLPEACTTDIVMTLNLRNFIHLCNERLCTRAQWEIRKMIRMMVERTIEVESFSQQEKDFLAEILVPKCQRGVLHYCTEGNQCCGLSPKVEDYVLKEDLSNEQV